MSHTRLHLEFAPNARTRSPAAWLFLIAALLLLAVLAVQVGHRLYSNAQQRQATSELDLRERPEPPKTQASVRGDPKEASRLQWARQTSRHLMAPWADLFAALESAPSSVALLVVEPSADTRSVSLTAEAANATEMLNYLQALQSDARFANVVLLSHAVEVQTPGSPLRFQLRASWGETP